MAWRANSDSVATRLKHAITWRLVAELMRRHKASVDLNVLELHPGGGLGETLAIYRRSAGRPWPGEPLNDLRGFRRLGEAVESGVLEPAGGYVWPWVCAEDPRVIVDEVERLLGLPSAPAKLAEPSPSVVAFTLMADVLAAAATARETFEWRMSFFDHSGHGEVGPREQFLRFPHVVATVPAPNSMREYARFWLLLRRGPDGLESTDPAAIVDLRGRAWFGAGLRKHALVADLVHGSGRLAAAAALLTR